jgi:hypothetical protein
MSTSQEIQIDALDKARNGNSLMNYRTIYEEFEAKGIPPDDILPRQNVFTYNAWLALNRQVKKGEHGVKVCTWVPVTKTDKTTGEKEKFKRPKLTTVFHVTQTEAKTS